MLTRYNPWTPFAPFGDITRTYKNFDDTLQTLFGNGGAARPWTPPVDIVETENDLVLKADLPEVKPEDIDVKFEDGTLTLRGKREFEKREDSNGYHRIERGYGSFVRAFTLPETVDPEKLTADYNAGVLTITIGKKEIAKPRAVKVNVKAA
jgi:HSP20 family protein